MWCDQRIPLPDSRDVRRDELRSVVRLTLVY